MGAAAQEDGFCRKLMNFTDVSVVAVDHRLAPEHPYPEPLEDCYATLLWLMRQPWVDPARVAIGGASAGGGFAAALALLARDRAEVTPALRPGVLPVVAAMGSDLGQPSTVVALWPPLSHPACDNVVTISVVGSTRNHPTKPFAADNAVYSLVACDLRVMR